MSQPEVLLWRYLRLRPLGMKFRRQHPAGPYVLDFYAPAARLCIEIDGGLAHAGQRAAAHDARRDTWLAANGIGTVRIAAARVIGDAVGTADAVARMALARTPSPPAAVPLPAFGREDILPTAGGGARPAP